MRQRGYGMSCAATINRKRKLIKAKISAQTGDKLTKQHTRPNVLPIRPNRNLPSKESHKLLAVGPIKNNLLCKFI